MRGTRWKPEEILLIEKLWGKKTIKHIAEKLDRTEYAVIQKANKLGLQQYVLNDKGEMNKKGAKWLEKDLEYLRKFWGEKSVDELSKKLKRSAESIISMANICGMGGYFTAQDYIPVSRLGKILYSDKFSWDNSFLRILQKNGCPLKELERKRKILCVSVSEFWKWAAKHKKLLNFAHAKLEEIGYYPQWAEEKQKVDYRCRYKSWSKKEVEQLKAYVQWYPINEISERMNRSRETIYYKCKKLGLQYIKNKRICRKWTDDDVKIMVDLHKQGYNCAYIASKLKRSDGAVRDKLKRFLGQA